MKKYFLGNKTKESVTLDWGKFAWIRINVHKTRIIQNGIQNGMELSSKLSKISFEISTKREATAIVSVGFQNQRISPLEDF